ncbi:MAG: DUF2007 domain-containing protein [Anaerolineaceae bacterium]|nr:DUF2007 domain-containing protein [Anaerolineaceae bacterium]
MKLVKVYTTAGDLEAEFIKGFLHGQGIEAVISQESVAKTLGLTVGRLGEVKILVPEEQAEEAATLLKAMDAGEFEDSEIPEEPNEE